ncbi:hypothetical protein [Streptomyces collinus]|uniref:hypothetical protein n=1 Tax=Streptomyces collinus TaxID=42684 RepID=UPI0036A329F9
MERSARGSADRARRCGRQPQWLIQHALNRNSLDAVHTGDCWAAAKSGRCRPATRLAGTWGLNPSWCINQVARETLQDACKLPAD